MKEFIKNKFVTIIIASATVVLAGIAIFTAVRLYQLRQDSVANSNTDPNTDPNTDSNTDTNHPVG